MNVAFGRNRESVADLEHEVYELFMHHPNHRLDENDVPCLTPADVPDVLREWALMHDFGDLLSDEELQQYVNMLSAAGPLVQPNNVIPVVLARGRKDEGGDEMKNNELNQSQLHSSSSDDSANESALPPRPHSRSQSLPTPDSPFDAKNRQRSRPLAKEAVPSSWNSKRPMPHGRRKSDAGSSRAALSDSESSPMVSPGTRGTRARAPSNPVSPSADARSPYSSRPPSRSQSRNGYYRNLEAASPTSSATLFDSVQNLAMQRQDSDSDEEYERTMRSRISTPSTASMAPEERVDALTRLNEDLARKLMEAESTMSRKLQDHDDEILEMENRLEELKQELAAKNREEKELRAKERANTSQINILETEVAKLQRNVENSRQAYQALQKQYQEQCAESEKYRNMLRAKDEEIAELNILIVRSSHEDEKKDQSRLASELRVAQLEEELIAMREAEGNLDLQKAENLLLKETIDRLRFELDEMTVAAQNGGTSNASSAAPTLSKSLGAEMARSMQSHLGEEDRTDEGLAEDDSGEETEGEEEIQTIITRKRKVAGRANKNESFVQESTKEVSDAYTQYDPDVFTSTMSTQTDPVVIQPEQASEQSRSMAETSTMSTLVEDSPPLYTSAFPNASFSRRDEEESEKVALRVLKHWHKSDRSPFDPIPGGIPREALEEWEILKGELGLECLVIDKALQASAKVDRPTDSRLRRRNRGSRFYNIYNTYVYGSNGFPTPSIVTIVGVVAAIIIIQPFLPTSFQNPGMPTYSDRIAWNAFNTMQPAGEGFAVEDAQAPAILGMLGRVLFGASRMAANRLRPPISIQ